MCEVSSQLLMVRIHGAEIVDERYLPHRSGIRHLYRPIANLFVSPSEGIVAGQGEIFIEVDIQGMFHHHLSVAVGVGMFSVVQNRVHTISD